MTAEEQEEGDGGEEDADLPLLPSKAKPKSSSKAKVAGGRAKKTAK